MLVLKKGLSIFSTVFVIFLIFLAYGSFDNRWYRVVTIEGNSMAPTLWLGDLMVVTPARDNVAPDSIIVMRIGGSLVTHRLVGYDESGHPISKGDANEVPDNWDNPDLQIIGVCRLRMPGLGYPILFLSRLLGKM